jgi:hypothetical protein
MEGAFDPSTPEGTAQNGSPKSNGYRIKFLKKATENSARKTAEYMLGMTTS